MEQNEKPNIFGIGISGLVGSRIVELLSSSYNIQNLSIDTGVDITDPSTLQVVENDTEHPVVIHLAAKADVDGCEADKPLGKVGAAWKINVEGTQHVVDACRKSNKKIIYISTDFVFDGEKPEGESYSEEDTPHPINWYAETKYRGEEIVRESGLPFLILRLAYPYRIPFEAKNDLVQAMLSRLKKRETVSAVTDHLMSPTYVDDFAVALGALLQTNATGIYHVVGSQALSPYDLALQIARTFNLSTDLIRKTSRSEFFKDRAPRPFNLALNNAKIEKLGVQMKTVTEGLEALKNQIDHL